MPMSQDPGAIQPYVGVEPHTIQAPRVTGDGPLETSSNSSANLQVQESHQAMSSRQTEGRTKASKKKKKGSNKLPGPETKEFKSPMAHIASGHAKPEAREKTSVEEACKIPDDSGHLEEKENQSAFEIEFNKVTAAIVPLEPTCTLIGNLEIVDQSFLGCNPTENNGQQPTTSVGDIVKASGAKAGKIDVSETALTPMGSILSAVSVKQSKEPVSQAMRREGSNSTQGSASTDLSILSDTGPSSISQTECSNSISPDKLSPVVQAAHPSSEAALLPPFLELGKLRDNIKARMVSSSVSQSKTAIILNRVFEEPGKAQEARLDGELSDPIAEPEEITMERISASLAPPEMGKEPFQVQKEVQSPIMDESEGLQLGLIEENPQQTPNMFPIQPSTSKCERIFSMSPTRESALSIPPRSSSLAAPATPIKTHQKKKPRNLTPVKEVSSSIEGMKMDSSLQTTGSTKLEFPVLTIDPAARILTADQPRDLPKPETPFLMDNGVRVAPPKINRRIAEASNADRYYAQKNYHQVCHWGNATQINATFCSLDFSGSTSSHVSEASISDHISVEIENDLETTLREAGFRGLSTTSPFTIKTPELAWLETIDGVGRPIENCNKDEPMLILDKGKVGQFMSWDAWTKQQEMIEVVKKAAAVKRLMTGSPPLLWTKIVSLRKQLSRFVTHVFSNEHEQQTIESRAQQCLKARTLLDTIPQRDSSISEMRKWSRRVSLFMDENASKLSRASTGSRKSTTSNSGGSFRGTSLQRQQPECPHPVPICQPDPQTLARKHGRDEDAFPTANTELNYSPPSGQTTGSEPSPSTCGRQTPSEDGSTSSVILTPFAALSPATKLKDLFVGMGEDRRRSSDDCHRFSTPEEEERMTISDPEIISIGGELDEIKVEQKVKQTEVSDEPQRNKAQGLGCTEEKDQEAIVKTEKSEEPTPTRSEEDTPQRLKDLAHQKHTSLLIGVSFQSSGSNDTTITEGVTNEAQHIPPRGEHSPLMRGGYNAVAGRGVDGRRGGKNEASKDPWALPQGEKPWGNGCEGRGWKKMRERQ